MSATPRRWAIIGAMVAFVGATGIGLFITGAVTASSAEETAGGKVNTSVEKSAIADFPTNSNGLTYGSDAFLDDKMEGPDLVAVVGDNGVAGYVKSADLDGPDFATPEEALEWQQQNPGNIVIDVYDVSGEKVIDTFTLIAPQVEER